MLHKMRLIVTQHLCLSQVSWLIKLTVDNACKQVLVEPELLTLMAHPSFTAILVGSCCTILVFCDICFTFFIWPLCSLFLRLQLLIVPLVLQTILSFYTDATVFRVTFGTHFHVAKVNSKYVHNTLETYF